MEVGLGRGDRCPGDEVHGGEPVAALVEIDVRLGSGKRVDVIAEESLDGDDE